MTLDTIDNMDQKQRLLDLLDRLITRGNQHQFKLLFHKFHEADIAEALESLSPDQRFLFFSRLKSSNSVDVFEELNSDLQIEIIQNFKTKMPLS